MGPHPQTPQGNRLYLHRAMADTRSTLHNRETKNRHQPSRTSSQAPISNRRKQTDGVDEPYKEANTLTQ